MTVCVQLALLPCTSVTVHTTPVEPTKYTVGALLVRLATPQLSAVAGVPRATLVIVQPLRLAFVVTLAGQVIVGGSVSRTVPICEHVLLRPLVSTTVQCTVVVPTGNCVGVSLVTLATPQLSPVMGVPSETPVA